MSSDLNDAVPGTTALKPMPEVLTTMSHEMRLLSDAAGELQDLVGNLVTAGAINGTASLYRLQSLDSLCQNLEAIADFAAELSKHAKPDWKVDVASASRPIRLAEMSSRLSGQHVGPGDETGEFECFESWSQAV